jgi:hypothetical protein
MTTALQVLKGTGRSGDAIHQGQQMGTDKGFGKVSEKWLKQCLTYEQGLQKLHEEQAQTEDIMATVRQMRPHVGNDGRFGLQHVGTKKVYRPTEHAIGQMADWAKIGSFFAMNLMTAPEKKGKPLFSRDAQDAETLAMAVQNGFRRLDQEKTFLWRVRQDGTLRAMLTERYAIVQNEWFIESLRKIIPGGMLSHWKGDSDTIWGNILIPDTIRQEDDSDYGGMTSVSNSEIGERRVGSMPSVFRAICQNGCIWDQKKGAGIRTRHVGEIDLDELFKEIKENLDAQIPLIPQGIETLLGTKRLKWDGASTLPLYAQVAKEFKMTKGQAQQLLKAQEVEAAETPDLRKTLFGVIASVTRAGQSLSNEQWFRFDVLGGTLANYTAEDWRRMTSRAVSLTVKEVDEALSLAA